jgi:subtilisin family serine protease|tara:strand:+ start:6581 stop:10822 length:4242 start_codon:yes stop_codon:yes gene_type:complete
MIRIALPVLLLLVLVPIIANESFGYFGGDMIEKNLFSFDSDIMKIDSDIITVKDLDGVENLKRYIVFGHGSPNDISSLTNSISNSVSTSNGFFSIVTMPENKITNLESTGLHVMEDLPLNFHSKYIEYDPHSKISEIGNLANSKDVHELYNVTGNNITIAIVDTGVDFSNKDMQHAIARDKENIPIMLDADGQGIILTNATFAANIDQYGTMKNFTKSKISGLNTTSSVYVKAKNDGVFLNLLQNGNGTSLLVYNSLYPMIGSSPLLNGTINDDMKIGKNMHDYIVSKSGVYRLGVMYQAALSQLQVVPVLVTDTEKAGVYDTIIPDMSTSWMDFIRDKNDEKVDYDFDFTDETPRKLGDGNEFLMYDFDNDGEFDYSAGTIGAQVLDIYGVIDNEAKMNDTIGAVNGTLLPPIDDNGEFFGVMTDPYGHGTSSAATIISKGTQEYDIYNNTSKFTIKGVAPDSKIIPVKALWFGDIVYSWLWSAGFDNDDLEWKFSGSPRADIISNSWGISNFPVFDYAPGHDLISLIMTALNVPGSLSDDYPGVLMVISAGNSGHGYGTIGLPSATPSAITVGATTSNVFVGYEPFKDEPRFGNTTIHSDHVVDFSSRGPSIIGDPKPDLMSIGAYSFTPTAVTQKSEDSTEESFRLFGGTSMAAPIVSGSAALVMQSLNEKSESFAPYDVKNILMSSAIDLQNDVFTQGTGLVDSLQAVRSVHGHGGTFIVHNTMTSSNIESVLHESIANINSTAIGFEEFMIPINDIPQTSWFGGRLGPGEPSTTTFTIENPTNKTLEISIIPQKLELIEKFTLNGTTEPHLQDSFLNKTKIYRPNYIPLANLTADASNMQSSTIKNIFPNNSSLLVLNANFEFDTFMNKTNPIYADDLRISSLYLYDWNDKNSDTEISSDELSLVNRGGSWGTVQELRITEPEKKFEDTPVIGVYPVPSKYSFWIGDIHQNSTSMNYSLTASYFAKDSWDELSVTENKISVPPLSNTEINSTIKTSTDQETGIYDGFLMFEGEHHKLNVPVSYSITHSIEKDIPVVVHGEQNNINYGSGFVKGAFDMTNRYMSGDWRQYFLEINDSTINSGAIEFSWKEKNTNFSVFVIDPQGKIISTNMPSGVFGHFLGWPSIDWLGTTPFSQGGGFFPVKNKDDTSTVLFAPINQTGTYSLLVHSTLFEGKELTEPITLAAKFTTVTPDDMPPEIILDLPKFVNPENKILPEINEDNLNTVTYFLDGNKIEIPIDGLDISNVTNGLHVLTISANDRVGFETTKSFEFIVDTEPPILEINSPKNNTSISNRLFIDLSISDKNLPETDKISFLLPTGERITDETVYSFNTTLVDDGEYEITVFGIDKAGNSVTNDIMFTVDHTIVDKPKMPEPVEFSPILMLVIAGIIVAIITGIIFAKRKRALVTNS